MSNKQARKQIFITCHFESIKNRSKIKSKISPIIYAFSFKMFLLIHINNYVITFVIFKQFISYL